MTPFPDALHIVVVLAAVALAPFVAVMVTSFINLVVVFALIRNALGIQQIPPNMVVNGLAIILTLYIMAPVGEEMYAAVKARNIRTAEVGSFLEAAGAAREPLRRFLLKHSRQAERVFFMESARSLWPEERARELRQDDLMVLVPAFTVSELTSAFQIGFLLYLPFVAIDLVVSNILLAMGMMMVSPMTISLPFKLLLFVLVDGWGRLVHGLVLMYR
ncbi:MAG TPA: type III secretion system export apparatus subunit SctR [Syntrophales bacterium]|nr:type III secretion system export apparatus subunit SctR [Syntrophales bacterium]HQN77713.1 type III secretion system export apparatus subunit SctR [Syntrophales bacterium]HQQ27099.1 type III secretion system export apparatus subunit SctR [Syntrophales bacterium]